MAVPIQYIEGDFVINTHGTHIASQFTPDSVNSTPASATFGGLAALVNDFSVAFSLINTDGSAVLFTASAIFNYNVVITGTPSVPYIFGTKNIASDQHATETLHIVFKTAIADGDLKMTLAPAVYVNETSITLTQNVGGEAGNTPIDIIANITIQGGGGGVGGIFTGGLAGMPMFSVGASAKVVPCLRFRNKPYILSKGGNPSEMG